MLDTSTGEVQFAIEAVREAARLAREVEQEMIGAALTKEDKSPVTVADYAIQALIGCMLQKVLPGSVLVAEEGSAALREPDAEPLMTRVAEFVGRRLAYTTPGTVCTWIDYGAATPAKRFWTLDPVDGTKGFLRGDQYATALALVEDGKVQVGVLGCPNLDDATRPDVGGKGTLVVAVRGQGTWATPLLEDGEFRRLHVSDIHEPAEARLLRSFESGHTNVDQMGQMREALGAEAEPVRMDSQAKYAVLAAGAGDLLLRLLSPKQPDYRETIWDQAAGSLVVEEAGGLITDLSGKPLDFSTGRRLTNNRGVLDSNGLLHEAALQALKKLES